MSTRPLQEVTTVNLKGELPFPDPIAVLSLAHCRVFRAVDEHDQPILVVTDGVTTVALECGLRGLTNTVVRAAQGLADGVNDYVQSVRSAAARQSG